MGESTGISWTDKTWNPLIGCSRVSAGCQHCYAERFAHRGLAPQHRGLTTMSKSGPRWTGEVRTVPEMLSSPLHWKKPRAVFVNSMSDLFHEKATFEYIAAVFGVMAASPQHTFVILTKRDPRKWFEWVEGNDRCSAEEFVQREAHRLLPIEFPTHPIKGTLKRYPWPLTNVVIGVSCEDQSTADLRIPWLLQTPAAKRIVSLEPLLGPIDLLRVEWPDKTGHRVDVLRGGYWDDDPKSFFRGFVNHSDMPGFPDMISGVIIGGESGTGALPCNVEWIRSIIEQCNAANVRGFVKQLGSTAYAERNESWCNTHPNSTHLVRATHDGLYDVSLNLKDRKGADMSEWPIDLRVRELPWRLSCSKS